MFDKWNTTRFDEEGVPIKWLKKAIARCLMLREMGVVKFEVKVDGTMCLEYDKGNTIFIPIPKDGGH